MDNFREKEFYDLLTQTGVYGRLKLLDKLDYSSLVGNREICKSLDLHCPNCKADKTFVRVNQGNMSWLGEFETHRVQNAIYHCQNLIHLLYECPTCKQKLFYTLLKNENEVIKLAQYPSLYDVSRDELKKYQKNNLIDNESFSQIYKAELCASSSYYVAAYTYMRRVYETMLLSVFDQNKEEIGITEDAFRKLHSDKKLEAIKDYLAIDDEIYLPLYGLLSAGIHAMTEEQCCEDYKVLKPILLDILAEQKAKKEKESKRKELKELFAKRKDEMK